MIFIENYRRGILKSSLKVMRNKRNCLKKRKFRALLLLLIVLFIVKLLTRFCCENWNMKENIWFSSSKRFRGNWGFWGKNRLFKRFLIIIWSFNNLSIISWKIEIWIEFWFWGIWSGSLLLFCMKIDQNLIWQFKLMRLKIGDC